MNKIKIFLFLIIFPIILFCFNSSIRAQIKQVKQNSVTTVNSYELFWPIVAGKVEGDSLYSLKLFKEKVREMLILSDFKKADYNILIAEKRIVEAEKLINDSKFEDAKKTLDRLSVSLEKVVNNIKAAEKSGIPVESLQNRLTSSLEKQIALMEYLTTKLPSANKDLFTSVKTQVDKILSE